MARHRKQTAAQRRASLRNLAKARRARKHHGNWGPKSAKRGRRISGKTAVKRLTRYDKNAFYWVKGGVVYKGHSVKRGGGGGRKKGKRGKKR
jgi:hypothetical protein